MKIFVTCPVRGVTEEETEEISAYVADLEHAGHQVHWPARDTNQLDDPIGTRICEENVDAIEAADQVHVWWADSSTGTLFDLGAAFALGKLIVVANLPLEPTAGKSFRNVVLALGDAL
jgi:nucleoside 2-deoxyribosyltransferase